MKTHAQIKELLAHYDFLPPRVRTEVDGHVATCAECSGELAARAVSTAPRPVETAEPPAFPVRASRAHLGEPPPQLASPLPVPEPVVEPAPAFPWRRLLLPAGLILLFVASIVFSMRQPARGPKPPVRTPGAVDTPGSLQTPASETTILFACDDVAAVYNDYARLARAFEKDNPDVKVELKSYRDLLGNDPLSYTQTMQEVAANADAFCVWDVAPLVDANLLYDIDPLVAAGSTFDLGDFYAAVLDNGRDRGRLYAIPSRFQPALIRYDPAAFDQVGLPYPRPGWTWDDFLLAAKALTRREDGNTQRWGFAEDAPVVFNARFRVPFADPALSAARDGNPLDIPAVADLFRWYERIYVDERTAPVPRNLEDVNAGYLPISVDPRDVSRGKMAMWTDLMYQNARRQGKPATFPADGSRGGAPIYTSAAWAIAAETLHADAAWRWLVYLSRNPPPDGNQLRLPARRSLVEQLPFWEELPADEAEVYRYVLDHLETRADSRTPGELAPALYRLLGRMVSSQLTVSELRAGVTGSSGASGPIPTNIPPVTLAVPRDQLGFYRGAANAYMQATFNTNVQVIEREALSDPTRAEDTTLWQQMRQVANRADVIAGPGVAALARSGRAEGILLDLTPLVADLPPGRDFYPNTLESLAWRGRTWAVPDRVFAYMIAYYPAIFDQMGAAHPYPGWSWEEFEQAARAVTQPSADKMKWWGFSDGAGGTLPLLLSATGPLVDYGADRPEPLLDTASVTEAARRYAGLWRQGYITVPDVRETTRDMAAPRQAAMWVELVDPAEIDALRQAGISLAPFPAGASSEATTPIEIENAFAISADSDRPDDAWKLIDFLLQYRAPGAPAGAPAQPAGEFAGEWRNRDLVTAYEYALTHAQPAAPLRREEYFARVALVDAVTRLAIGERDVEQVMRDAQTAASARMGQ